MKNMKLSYEGKDARLLCLVNYGLNLWELDHNIVWQKKSSYAEKCLKLA